MTYQTPKVGDVYSDRDPSGAYRVEVVQIDPQLLLVGKKGIQLRNRANGRRHWTSERALYRNYARVTP